MTQTPLDIVRVFFLLICFSAFSVCAILGVKFYFFDAFLFTCSLMVGIHILKSCRCCIFNSILMFFCFIYEGWMGYPI